MVFFVCLFLKFPNQVSILSKTYKTKKIKGVISTVPPCHARILSQRNRQPLPPSHTHTHRAYTNQLFVLLEIEVLLVQIYAKEGYIKV